MDDWKKFSETSLPKKEDFYSNLNVRDITDADYRHAKPAWKYFEIKNLGKYDDLYVRSDTVLLANLLENFQNICLGIYKFDPACFFTAAGLA